MPPLVPKVPVLHSFSSLHTLTEALAAFVVKAQNESIENPKKGKFTVALSGGSLPKMLEGLIGNPAVKWHKWQIFYVDERVVSLDDPESNHHLCMSTLFSKIPDFQGNIHTIEPSPDLEEVASGYEQLLIQEFAQRDAARYPVFDLILLGIGPDGHTASLFPGHKLLTEGTGWVAYIDDSPKPPPRRITLTYPVINHAARVAFVVTGESKADVLATILDDPGKGLPASRVKPASGQLYWFVDDAASSKVECTRSPFKLEGVSNEEEN